MNIKENFRGKLNEKLMLKDWNNYMVLVTEAYEDAEDFDSSVVNHWNALNQSNYKLFKRLLSKVNVVFVSGDKSKEGTVNIEGREFKVVYLEGGQPYDSQPEMKKDFENTGVLKISIDYSDHPIFSVKDNIVFRTVHDYIVHILGNHDFSGKGEIASYNRHVKLAPKEAIPALFTEVVGQASYAIIKGGFPKQKIALEGFDYYNLGVVDDENYEIVDKKLVHKSKLNKAKSDEPSEEPSGEPQQKAEPELELAGYIKNKFRKSINEMTEKDFIVQAISNHECSIISAFRDKLINCANGEEESGEELSLNDNLNRHKSLKQEVIGMGYKVVDVDGVYIENYGTEDAKEMKEASLFIINEDNRDSFVNDMKELGIEYCQDAVLIVPKGGQDAYFIGTNNAEWPGMNNIEIVGSYKQGPSEFMTTYKGKPFHFG